MADETIELSEPMKQLVKRFRRKVYDTDPLLNILNDFKIEFSDEVISGWIEEAVYMINEAEPVTSHRLERFPKTALLLDGAVIQMLEARGLLHLRNQLSYSDAGFSVNMDDKAGHYAQWLAQKASIFYQDLKQFKRRPPRFVGVDSPMRRW